MVILMLIDLRASRHAHRYPWPPVAVLDLAWVGTGQGSTLVTLGFLHMAGRTGLWDSLSGGGIDRVRFVDKQLRIYGADCWVMNPDCGHGVSSTTSQSRIVDIGVKTKYVCVCVVITVVSLGCCLFVELIEKSITATLEYVYHSESGLCAGSRHLPRCLMYLLSLQFDGELCFMTQYE